MKKSNLAGIVLYNPDKIRLKENINAIISQVDELVLVDNGSKSQTYLSETNGNDKIVIIRNENNKGIAAALNQILRYAEGNNYDWILTLDQDSVVGEDIMNVYSQYMNQEEIGMLSCDIVDRNFEFSKRGEKEKYVNFCITSGSYLRVDAWKQIRGFDESMFIDSVDLDFCLSLREHGWKIYRTFETNILHEVGRSKVIKIFGKEYLALNHNPFRYYYIIRNIIYVGRKHRQEFGSMKIASRVFYTVLFHEKQKREKLIYMFKGLVNGLVCKINKNE